ncbi:MAG: hypothetical protein O2887_02645 [Bacteroidetes bacterium]|nr:hypothetical protein [Bacteroidota bacterium]
MPISIVLYAIGRGVIEIFRGDEERGHIIQGFLTHNQFISLLLVTLVIWYFSRLSKSPKADHSQEA